MTTDLMTQNKIEPVITPHGRIIFEPSESPDAWTAPKKSSGLIRGFENSNGKGLYALLREELPEGMPPSWGYLRKFAREFMTRLCHAAEPAGKDLAKVFDGIRPDLPFFGFLVLEAPPMRGAEYLSAEMLLDWWKELEQSAQEDLNAFRGSFPEWLREISPAWKQVGKVSFHLAENKQDKTGERPFAFMATRSG